jgi:putative transposase
VNCRFTGIGGIAGSSKLHGYALIGNHYHLQVESREANLSKAVHWLNVSYSVWFNRKYSRVGTLFQGRLKAILHEPTEALKINPTFI